MGCYNPQSAVLCWRGQAGAVMTLFHGMSLEVQRPASVTHCNQNSPLKQLLISLGLTKVKAYPMQALEQVL